MKVKMLAVLALVLLVFSASEGRILSKCELKSQLEAALGGNQGGNGTAPVTNGPGNVTTSLPVDVTAIVPENVTSGVPGNTTANSNLIAQIVCSVERVSKFNTSLVTTIQEDSRPSVRPPIQPPPRPPQQPNERPEGRPGRPGGRPRGKRSHPGALARPSARRPARPSDDSSSSESSEENSNEIMPGLTTRLFGIFQLSNRVACDSGSSPSLNLCRLSCSALIDDDIRDDITCLKILLDSATDATVSAFASLPKRKPHMISLEECHNVNPAQYFAECP